MSHYQQQETLDPVQLYVSSVAVSRAAFNLSSTCSFQIALGGNLAPTGWFCSICSLVKHTPGLKKLQHFRVTQFLVP